MKRTKLITFDEAVPATRQHKRPCSDCPWSRQAFPGWLGSISAEEWVRIAHGESLVDCHTRSGAQCAGIAIYQANVCKSPRDPRILKLPADRKAVFANPQEFCEHHTKKKPEL